MERHPKRVFNWKKSSLREKEAIKKSSDSFNQNADNLDIVEEEKDD